MSKNRISWLDVKLGARMLVKHPGLTVVGGLAIAVAVAVSTSMFTFIHSSLLPVLPLPEGDRIVALENWDTRENNEERRALRDLAVWRTELKSVRDVAAFRDLTRNLIGPGGPPEPVEVAEMTASGFRVARVPPLLGRYLVPADELSSAPPVVVIGHDVWQERFAGDPGVIGRSIRLGSSVHTVVGVMPERFGFPVSHNIWVPLRLDPALFEPKSGPEIFIFGRLAPGATREQAQAELTTLGKRAAAASPATHAQLEPRVLKYTEPILDIQGMTVWHTIPMQLAVTLLLVIVAANVAILVYARTASRHGELAVRSALGASRARIVTQLFAEMLLLAGGASLVGLAISQVGLRLVDRLMYNDLGTGTPFWTDYTVSPLTVAWVVLLALFTAAVAGVVPALTATGRRLQDSLRRVSGGSQGGMGGMWTTMVVMQVAIAVAGLPLAVAMGWKVVSSVVTRPAYDGARYIAAHVAMDPEVPVGADPQEHARALRSRFGALRPELARRLEAEPGVSEVVFSTNRPSNEGQRRVEIEGVAAPGAAKGHKTGVNRVETDFFRVFGAPLLAGRVLTPADLDTTVNTVVVNRAFVRDLLGGGNAIGRHVRYADVGERGREPHPNPWLEIVGVVGNLEANEVDEEHVAARLYQPLRADGSAGALLTLHVPRGAPANFTARLREIAAGVEPTLRVGEVRTLDSMNKQEVQIVQLVGLGLGLVMLSVLLLSAAGIYAMMSFTVTQRRKEIGIRSALGAQPRRLLAGLFRRAAWQLALGVGVGVGIAFLLDLASNGEMMGVRGAVAVPAVAVVMLVVGLLATFGPARRGLRIEPSEALRADG